MPRMQECLISIEFANALRALVDAMDLRVPEGNLGFTCPECGQPVKPHDASENQAAHFEHLNRNADCSLSDPSPRLSAAAS